MDIQLHTPIAITGFSLEHIPSAIAYDVTSAPKVVSLETLTAPLTHKVKGGAFTVHKTHGPFRYDLRANSAVQTFSIFSESPEPASFVRLKVRLQRAININKSSGSACCLGCIGKLVCACSVVGLMFVCLVTLQMLCEIDVLA